MFSVHQEIGTLRQQYHDAMAAQANRPPKQDETTTIASEIQEGQPSGLQPDGANTFGGLAPGGLLG